jgi:hypothetical protein
MAVPIENSRGKSDNYHLSLPIPQTTLGGRWGKETPARLNFKKKKINIDIYTKY